MKLTKAAQKAVLKNSAICAGNMCLSHFFMKLQTFRPSTLLKRDSKTGVFLLQNFWETYIEEYLRIGASELILQSDCPKLVSGQSLSKPSSLSNITKILVAFKPKLFLKQNSAYAVFI